MQTDNRSITERLASLNRLERAEILAGLPDRIIALLTTEWAAIARPSQLPPDGDWTTWLLAGGRGSGKTRTASEWVHDGAIDHYIQDEGRRHTTYRIAAAGRAAPDVRDVVVEGETGLMAVAEARSIAAKYEPSKRRITWPDLNATCTLFSAEEPDQARGPQSHRVWCDELSSWDLTKTDAIGNNLYTNLKLGARLGVHPRILVTTTPKRVPIIRELTKAGKDPDNPAVVYTHATMMENAANLAPTFIQEVTQQFEGTSLYDQEVLGLLLDDDEFALWDDTMIARAHRYDNDPDAIPKVAKKLVAVDPPKTATGDRCGIIIVGLLEQPLPGTRGRCAIVLGDYTVRGSPDRWGRRVVSTAYEHGIRKIVIEDTQGGEMAEDVVRNRDERGVLDVERVGAFVSKELRAEPVSQLYEQGRVIHVGEGLEELEQEMVDFLAGIKHSPDRLDALVHGITAYLPELNQRLAYIGTSTGQRIDRSRGVSGMELAEMMKQVNQRRLTTTRFRQGLGR